MTGDLNILLSLIPKVHVKSTTMSDNTFPQHLTPGTTTVHPALGAINTGQDEELLHLLLHEQLSYSNYSSCQTELSRADASPPGHCSPQGHRVKTPGQQGDKHQGQS